jgi:Uma2 family endonuclease
MSRVEGIKDSLKWLSGEELRDVADWLGRRISAVREDHAAGELAAAEVQELPPHVTIDEYFAFEESSQFKHEYVNGALYPINGPSVDHVRITCQLLVAFATHLRNGPCEALASNLMLRIHVEDQEIVYRPDLVIACNKKEWGKHYVRNPKLVAEVLSPSTQDIDRREKAMHYNHVRSIEEYVFVEQDEYRVVVHRRADNWIIPQVYAGPDAVVEFRSIGLAVPLKQIYAGTLQ